MFDYEADVVRVIDGDTCVLNVDLGFRIKHTITVRLAGIDAPEMNTDEGKDAASWLRVNISNSRLFIHTEKDRTEKYGRYLAWIWNLSQDPKHAWSSINMLMVDAGMARRSAGKR